VYGSVLEKSVLEATGVEIGGDPLIPDALGNPRPPGSPAKALSDVGRQTFDLADPIRLGNERQNWLEERPAKELHLFSLDHLGENIDELRVVLLEPFDEQARVVHGERRRFVVVQQLEKRLVGVLIESIPIGVYQIQCLTVVRPEDEME